MKRRSGDCGKIRRPGKRSKLAEGIYTSTTFVYLKFLSVWALVLLADFIVEFRFEYLWPFWLLLRSVYDSFKYQGLAFSMFFVLIALTSDMICFLFIPVHWLFFAASTYVWVQYVWHTERGICLPTVSLWLLFVYIEASVRLKELKTPSSSHHLDLCRPFAAHCIGYPVVTLGFGVKSYLSYRMRLRKQREVAKVNDFYFDLLQKALPDEVVQAQKQQQQSLLTKQQLQQQEAVADTMVTEKVTLNGSPVSNGHLANGHHHHSISHTPSSNNSRKQVINGGVSSSEKVSSSSSSSSSSTITNLITPNNHHQSRQHEQQCLYLLPWQNRRSESSKSSQQHQQNSSSEHDAKPRSSTVSSTSSEKTSASSPDKHNHQNSTTTNELHSFDRQYMEQKIISSISSSQKPSSKSLLSTVNDFDEDADFDVEKTSFKHSITASLNSCPGSVSNSLNTSCSSTPSKWSNQSNILNSTNSSSSSGGSSSGKKNKPDKNHVVNNLKDQSSVSSPTSSPVTNGGVLKDSTGDLVASNHLQRLEADIKRLKADLQASRQTEQDLRVQVASLLKGKLEEEKLRAQLEQLQADNEALQSKLQNLITARQQDKANISLLEKKVQDEKKLKATLETQLNNERESKKKKDQADQAKLQQQQQAVAAATRSGECTESCKAKRREMENDIKTIRRDLKLREDQLKQLERETHSLRAYKDSHGDTEILMSALSAMQEKNAHLESSLSAETRLKLDLFSALGDTKRQLEISQVLMAQKDREIDELKSKIAEVMACMPSSVHPSLSSNPFSLDNSIVSSILFNSKFLHDSSASTASTTASSSVSGREVSNDLQ